MASVYKASKRVILCVDDDAAVLSYEKVLLETSGYAVLTAASAQQALRLVTLCRCDAVLLDYELPGTNGYELAVAIKGVVPRVAIILFSGCEVPPHALTVVDAFVPKLEASRRLLPMIAELCSEPDGVSETQPGRADWR